MLLSLVGTLPVSALNVGLAASLPVVTAKIGKLTADISNLIALGPLQAAVALNVPNITTLGAGIAAQLTALPTLVSPDTWVTAGASANVSLGLQLGLIELQLQAALALQAQFEAGLSSGSLSLWTYTGRSAGFGESLASQTERGWGSIGPDQNVQAVVIATEDPASWGAFSLGFQTGRTVSRIPAGPEARLTFEGVLGGESVNTGVAQLKGLIDLGVLDLKGAALTVQAQVQVSLGVNLPSLSALKASLQAVIPSVALSNLLNVHVDIVAQVGAIQLQLNAALALSASLQAQLSAGGLTVWSYNGPASDLGASLRSATAGGLPKGSGPEKPVYGVVLASQFPMVAFGTIFKVA